MGLRPRLAASAAGAAGVAGFEAALVAAVWFPSLPLIGAAVAAHLAAFPGVPPALADLDRDWAEAASILLDQRAPAVGPPDDPLGPAARGAGDVSVVEAPLDGESIRWLRNAGGGVVSLPAALAAAPVAAEADAVVFGIERSFMGLRRARSALDELPPSHRRIVAVLVEAGPSGVRRGDVARVLELDPALALPDGGAPLATRLERGGVGVDGPWADAVAAIAAAVWPAARTSRRARRRLLPVGRAR